MLPDGCDVTSGAYLKNHINGFLCADGYMNIWSFATSTHQKEVALTIRNRKDELRMPSM